MFNKHRQSQYSLYQKSRQYFLTNPDILIALEQYFSDYIFRTIQNNIASIKEDYDEASCLFPFWQQYPPDERGRQPRGDQYPWIEVGEHVFGEKLPRFLQKDFVLRDVGLPTGPDSRFVLKSLEIAKLTRGFTDSVWLFIDIKSVGPRDDFDHTVMSHNQISGDGLWSNFKDGIKNSVMMATGKQQKHEFHCSVPPVYILSTGVIAPVILLAVKPVYKMLSLDNPKGDGGQPLNKVVVISIPNGLLLEVNPGYLKTFPGLLFPGKDDKQKNPLKVRSRISFEILKKIGNWRVKELLLK